MSTPIPQDNTSDLQYNYRLSSGNQSKRLVDNTDREPFEIRYSSPQMINGVKYPTNVSIDCTPGVYLTAVKPALEKISEGWQMEILNTHISCKEISNRREMSGRRVCTKAVFYLKEKCDATQEARAVTHFYHTSNTVQIQGLHLMSNGVTAPVWLTTNFLQPRASNHATKNAKTISSINEHIRSSSTPCCGSCMSPINPSASKAKDQELSCYKCNKIFHKKCTDRKSSTMNWRRSPWYCSDCITGIQGLTVPIPSSSTEYAVTVHHSANISPQSSESNPAVGQSGTVVTYPVVGSTSTPTAVSQTVSLSVPTISISTVSPAAQTAITASTHYVSDPEVSRAGASTLLPIPSTESPNTSSAHPTPRFPSASTRQRGSNINLNNAELEFQKTALNTCRGIISQQEAEIKRLKESLDIRNKRIVQLESQVGYASDMFGARDTTDEQIRDKMKELTSKLESVSITIEKLRAQPCTNSIVVNSCSSHHHQQSQDSSTQTTDTPKLSCSHQNPDQDCNDCGKVWISESGVQVHSSVEHTEPVSL